MTAFDQNRESESERERERERERKNDTERMREVTGQLSTHMRLLTPGLLPNKTAQRPSSSDTPASLRSSLQF